MDLPRFGIGTYSIRTRRNGARNLRALFSLPTYNAPKKKRIQVPQVRNGSSSHLIWRYAPSHGRTRWVIKNGISRHRGPLSHIRGFYGHCGVVIPLSLIRERFTRVLSMAKPLPFARRTGAPAPFGKYPRLSRKKRKFIILMGSGPPPTTTHPPTGKVI